MQHQTHEVTHVGESRDPHVSTVEWLLPNNRLLMVQGKYYKNAKNVQILRLLELEGDDRLSKINLLNQVISFVDVEFCVGFRL
jgi:hypothetical protein